MVYVTQAQTYTNSQIDTSTQVVGDSVIIRNYNDNYEVIAYRNVDSNSTNLITGRILKYYSFMIRNISSGAISRIGILPEEYSVTDVQFVTLRSKLDTTLKTTFCCFCGNRTHISDGFWTIDGRYVTPTCDSGFVGFFSMPQAINPSSSYTIKLRNVENTKHLTKLTAYAEYHGRYYNMDSCTYIDNAVLDVIGFPNDTLNKPSCLCRVKFYPEYTNGSIRWDNNIRTPLYTTEVVKDVIATNNYVITASMVDNDSSKIWLRCSIKETTLYSGGQQLNSNVFVIDMNTITGSNINTSSTARFSSPIRLCRISNNTFTISFYAKNNVINGYSGLFTYLLSYDGTNLSVINGFYDKDPSRLIDVTYMPRDNAIASLIRTSSEANVIHTIHFAPLSYKEFTLFMSRTCITSIATWHNSNNSYIISGGGRWGINKNLVLVEQRFGATSSNCLIKSNYNLQNCSSVLGYNYYAFPISYRYRHNPIKYPVTCIPFAPSTIGYNTICSQ